MKPWFIKRGYQERLIENKIKKIIFNRCHFNSKNSSKEGIALVVGYHSLSKSLSKTIRKNLYLLHLDEEVKRVFTPGLVVSFRSSKKLGSYLVGVKV